MGKTAVPPHLRTKRSPSTFMTKAKSKASSSNKAPEDKDVAMTDISSHPDGALVADETMDAEDACGSSDSDEDLFAPGTAACGLNTCPTRILPTYS